jgi:hypothetical protein
MIRPAKFCDIMAMVGLWKAAHMRSEKYKRATFDEKEAQKRLKNCILAHGIPRDGGSWCMVFEKDGWLQGFIIGFLDRVEDVGVELFATDWKFLVDPAADARAALLLRDSFMAWAQANPRVIEIVVGVHDALGGDYRRTAKLWEQKGLSEIGLILGMNIERESVRKAG